MARYVIFSFEETADDGVPRFWSNTDGWTHLEFADTFTQEERDNSHRLPIEGTWVTLPDDKARRMYKAVVNLKSEEACWVADQIAQHPDFKMSSHSVITAIKAMRDIAREYGVISLSEAKAWTDKWFDHQPVLW